MQPGEEVPALFGDPVYQRAAYWVLSTSAIFSKHFTVYGWGEVCSMSLLRVFPWSFIHGYFIKVVPDGFGVAYMTGFEG